MTDRNVIFSLVTRKRENRIFLGVGPGEPRPNTAMSHNFIYIIRRAPDWQDPLRLSTAEATTPKGNHAGHIDSLAVRENPGGAAIIALFHPWFHTRMKNLFDIS